MRRASERLAEAARASFVGRERELAILRSAVASAELPFLLAWIHGPGGIGKTRLIRAFIDGLDRACPVVSLDCSQMEPTAAGLSVGLATALGEDAATPIGALVERAFGSTDRAVLVLDTYENFGLSDTWMRQSFLPSLPESVLTMIVGREGPNTAWTAGSGWGDLIRQIPLTMFEEREAMQMLESRGLSRAEAERINRFARGHPLALELAVLTHRDNPGVEIANGPPPYVIQQLTQAFLDRMAPEVRRAVEAASTVRRVTEPLLASLLDTDEAHLEYGAMGNLAIATVTPHGLTLHDVVRDTVAADVKQRSPELWAEYRRRAWRIFSARPHTMTRAELWQHTADVLYLIENPRVRWAFFPPGGPTLAVERATPDDGPAILSIASQWETPEAARCLALWWEHLPESFSVVRSDSQPVAGFFAMAEPAAIPATVTERDPLLSAWLNHLRDNPVAPGERVLILRRWLSGNEGEGLSAAQAASWLDIKRTYIELRTSLRRLYTTVNDLASYAPVVLPLGFLPAESLSMEVGAATYHSAMLDFGPDHIDGWLATRVGIELGIDELSTVPRPASLCTVLFTDLVGHTEMMSRLGDARGRAVLREHERITRDVLKAHGGTEVKTMGDGFMASFGSVTKAVECAMALQRTFAEREGEPLAVRVGLNAGEPIEEDGDLFGATVILASRIAAKAEGGEILVANAVREISSGKGFLFADRGDFVAKGFEEPVRLYEVRWRDD